MAPDFPRLTDNRILVLQPGSLNTKCGLMQHEHLPKVALFVSWESAIFNLSCGPSLFLPRSLVMIPKSRSTM